MTVHVVTVDVLEERPSERDIDHLLTATDAEDRDTRVDCSADERDLRAIEGQIDIGGLLLSHLTVQRRIDVPATRNQEAVDLMDDRRRAIGFEALRSRVERDRLSAGGFDRAEVGGVVVGSAERAPRDADLRSGDVRILRRLAA